MKLKIKKQGSKIALFVACIMLAAGVTGCAPKEQSSGSGGESASATEPVAVDFVWSADADCSTCHADESASMTDKATVAAVHGAEGDTCATCHTDSTSIATVHDGVTTDSKMPKKLKKTSIDEATCFSCHGTLEELAEKTADVTALTDSEGTTVNPHALPAGADHEKITCSDCHKMHGSETVGETAKKECLTCHHADVYECGTCHDA